MATIKTLRLLTGVACAAAMAAGTAHAQDLGDALSASKLLLDSDLRSESVHQHGFADDAEALTWRNRIGVQTGSFDNLSALVEFNVTSVMDGDYNSTLNGKTQYPTVLDPRDTEVNRAQLTWAPVSGTDLTVGRQRIQLDDQRFVGNSGWRQDEQTFDAVRFDTALDGLKLTGIFIDRVNRVVADAKDWHSNSYLVNASYAFGDALKVTAFDYDLKFTTAAAVPLAADITAARDSSVDITGARVSGSGVVSVFRLGYVAQYAGETPDGLNPARFDLHESLLEGSAAYGPWTVKLNDETLGGNGTTGFVTPIGTTHAFQGFADVFSATGGNKTFADGIDDLNLSVIAAGHTQAWAPWFQNPAATVVYHDLKADLIDEKIGTEWDGVLVAGLSRHLSLMLKYADFSKSSVKDPALPASRSKTWVALTYKL